MIEVLSKLKEKNNLLEKFYTENEVELLNFSEGNFENLDEFYNKREVILKMVKTVDRWVEDYNNLTIETDKINPEQKKDLIITLDLKNDLVNRILGQDLQILSFIEEAKSQIIRKLTNVRSAKNVAKISASNIDVPKYLDEEI